MTTGGETRPATSGPQAHAMLGLLKEADFRRLWTIGLLGGVGRWLEMLVAALYALELTGSPFLVALLLLLRMAPFALFGPVIGAFADRLRPRPFLAWGFALATLASTGVLACFLLGIAGYWTVAVASVVSGLVWTTDMPLRRRMLGDLAGPDRLAAAMGADSATGNGTRMLGPLLGGLLYESLGIEGAFVISVLLYGASAVMVLGLPDLPAVGAGARRAERLVREMREAVVYALRERDMTAILAVTVIFNIWCFPFVSMIPVIGAESLGLAPAMIGLLAATEGLGALVGALAVAMTARPRAFRAIYVGGTAVYLVLCFVVGALVAPLPVALTLFAIGLASSCFGSMQGTLVYASAPPAMRGRLFGLVVLCIGSGLLGFANIGLMGDLYGPSAAAQIVAVEGIVPLLLVALLWRRLWGRD